MNQNLPMRSANTSPTVAYRAGSFPGRFGLLRTSRIFSMTKARRRAEQKKARKALAALHRSGFFDRINNSIEKYFRSEGVTRLPGEEVYTFIARGLREAGGPEDRNITADEVRRRVLAKEY